MSALIENKSVLLTTRNSKIEVLEKLGEGGQGIVYKCRVNGKYYALKWYRRFKGTDLNQFYANLLNNYNNRSPEKTFVWPIGVTKMYSKNRFGYVMPLKPKGYEDFNCYLMNTFQLSFESIVNCAIQITATLKILHNKGYSYQDLNDGNFFVNPQNGSVLLCDNDNVMAQGKNCGIKGKSRYMAPEIISNKNIPDKYSDRFSLAVVLFLLFFKGHPLEGANDDTLNKSVPQNDMYLYCDNPVFVFDPKDQSNSLDKRLKQSTDYYRKQLKFTINRWSVYPQFIKDIFIKAFDKSVMNKDGSNRENRVTEKEWLKEFRKLKESLIKCPLCGGETFINVEDSKCCCMQCDKSFPRPTMIVINNRNIPIQVGMKLYKYELEEGDYFLDDIKDCLGVVANARKIPNLLVIENLSKEKWCRKTPGGHIYYINPNERIPVYKGDTIKFGTMCEAQIK